MVSMDAVRLRQVLVQLEDLPVPPAVTEMVLGDLPQALVEPARRRLHHVDLFCAVRPPVLPVLPAVRARGGGLRPVTARRAVDGPELLAHVRGAEQPVRAPVGRRGDHHRRWQRLAGDGAAGPRRPWPPPPRQGRRRGRGGRQGGGRCQRGSHGGGRGHQQRGGDQAVHERLHSPGQRYPPRHADVPHGRGHLGDHAPHQLQPGQPHHHGTGPEHGRGLEPVGEQGRRRHGVRDRQAEHRDQGYRGPDQQHEQHRDGAQAGEHVPSGTCPARLAVLPGHQHNAPWLIPHSGVAAACADSWKPANTPGIRGRVDTVTSTVARSRTRRRAAAHHAGACHLVQPVGQQLPIALDQAGRRGAGARPDDRLAAGTQRLEVDRVRGGARRLAGHVHGALLRVQRRAAVEDQGEQEDHRDGEHRGEHRDRAPLAAGPRQRGKPRQHGNTSRHMNGSRGATAWPVKPLAAPKPSALNGLMSTWQVTVTVTAAPAVVTTGTAG